MSEILIYNSIGAGGITAQAIVEALKAIPPGDPVTVRINSSGGDVMEGLAIYNALREVKPVVYVDGFAASMASAVAMAGAKVFMAENALMMIHKPWTNSTGGNANDLREHADLLDKVEQQLVKAYAGKTGLPENQIAEMLSKETWLDAAEALQLGFADEIIQPSQMAASLDLSMFAAVPEKIQAAQLANRERVTQINTVASLLGKQLPPEFVASLIADPRITIEQAHTKILAEIGKDAAPLGGCPHIEVSMSEQNQNFFNDATDALLARAGVAVKNISTGARDLAKYSVVNLAEQYLRLNGTNTQGYNSDRIIARAFEIRAAHTTSDFPHLLENVAAKSMRMAYMEEPASHVIWTGEAEVKDFKQNSLVQLSEAPDLEAVPEGGEYKHGSFGDEAEKFHIETFGKMFKITRQALINDDLQAFTRLPQAFGQSARRKEADLVYAVLTGNPDLADGVELFHTDHGNVVTGASTFNLAALASGRLRMRLQKGPAGLQSLNLIPRFLIVPAALETTAEQLIASIVDPSKSNDTPNAEFVRGLTLVVDSRLDDVSATTFYLAASPGQVDTITRAYLAGEGRPYIETREGWEVDAMEIKCRLDFAAVPADFRGLVRVSL